MTKSTALRVLVALATVFTMLGAGSAGAAPSDEASEHQRIIEFWTHERVAQAIPRDIVFERGPGFVPVGKPSGTPGNGPGGGGGGGDEEPTSGVVTGASWEGGGDIADVEGKVLFQLGSSYYVCSATVVEDDSTDDGDSVIVTAAHCVYDHDTGLATNWVFIPAYDQAPAPLTTNQSYCPDTVFGCWTAETLNPHQAFVDAGGFNEQAVENDFAFVTTNPGGHSGSSVLDSTVGAAAIDFDLAGDVFAFGYPAAKKYKGDDLVYCAGPVGSDPYGADTYRIECDMTGGSSGGGWLDGFDTATGAGTVTSVNSYGYRGDSGMYGPKLDGDAQALYESLSAT